ncbi:hypothetical protein Tco_0040022 [Tanacetum coccineum]
MGEGVWFWRQGGYGYPVVAALDIGSRILVVDATELTETIGHRKAPMLDLDIPAEFVAEDAQARKRFKEEQASERLVQRLRSEDLAQEYMPNVSEERTKELDELMMRMTETDWLNLMMQVGSNPALAVPVGSSWFLLVVLAGRLCGSYLVCLRFLLLVL